MQRWACFLVVVLFVSIAMGHSDPAGDIHPQVSVTQGVFIVKATENYFPAEPDVLGELEMRYSSDGKFISEKRTKRPEPEFKPWSEYSYIDELPEEKNGFEREVDGITYIIPEYGRKHGGKPYLIRLEDGVFTELDIEWAGAGLGGVNDVVFYADKIYFYMERVTDGVPELWIHRVSMKMLKEEASARFNIEAETIWGMAVTSNLLVYKGRCYVATINTDFWGHRLVLGVWDGESAECRTKNLTRKIDWNTSLHMANIDDNALIAYHYPGGRPRRILFPVNLKKQKNAHVKTIHFKLK
jgi:hypothetical protein